MSTSKPMSDGGKGSVRRNEDSEAYRNNYDAIFGRKSANAKAPEKEDEMIEDDPQDEDFEDDEDPICHYCNGSGEGMYDGSRCGFCKGTGIEPGQKVDPDYE